ncbi:hypothetical protein PUNSTDRAFT_111099 [Punctularia strigosozonata HHB-11173 SS5]|uniref:uncharacterized protein n=1 Tax=Punctularia strigosozonata (strain HHB-11173) TaxID=741275 RepID=UPI0004416AD4|nr:uncharacterized protein PUNSTDRAFT_111099 [Punctularia strigosozonata HHB-11173 SS5]EIN12696.1 hypothetical protein PUNSTDRAFT_111099 [Punctularia strigosozonata HHB-11173 SS5]
MAFNCPYTSPSLANIPVSSARQPVDLVTYRHEDELVYVTPALNYEAYSKRWTLQNLHIHDA